MKVIVPTQKINFKRAPIFRNKKKRKSSFANQIWSVEREPGFSCPTFSRWGR